MYELQVELKGGWKSIARTFKGEEGKDELINKAIELSDDVSWQVVQVVRSCSGTYKEEI